ncbi:hypothetical protein GGR58DRAFT_470079 [Xylaria digitata]|nr:hypothetical protein GGR58DRAFT_470079 [Xylaria digitata]
MPTESSPPSAVPLTAPAPSRSISPPSGVGGPESQTTPVLQPSVVSLKEWLKGITGPGQGCFVCLNSPQDGQYAVLVPCARPMNQGKGVFWTVGRHSHRIISLEPWNAACESDSAIWKRLVETCYENKGMWKKWIPFYGITEVREVNFQFLGVVDVGERYPICMMPVDCEEVKSLYQARLDAMTRDSGVRDMDDLDYDDMCNFAHDDTDDLDDDPEERLKRIPFQYILKGCALKPETANGLYSLEGFLQDSCMYEVIGPHRIRIPRLHEEFTNARALRGLYFGFGWQKDRLSRILPLHLSCVWMGVAIIWLGVLLWKAETGTWELAFGFGQVVASSIALLVSVVRV